MDQTLILQPLIVMLLLTIAVWFYLYVRRIGYSLPNNIDIERLQTAEKARAIFPEAANNVANNFINLFEVPVMFYVICLVLFVTQSADGVYLNAAWLFCGFRFAHSIIQCTYNRVMHRFVCYLISSLCVIFMVIRFALNSF